METNNTSPYPPDFLLDREAGLGWREQGMDMVLRDLLQQREDLIEEIERIKSEREVSDNYWTAYEDTIANIMARKSELSIGDPPPLSPEE